MSEHGETLELHSPPEAVVRRPRFKQRAEDYAEQLSVARRTIYRWLELGDAAGDWPPLDELGGIEEWWERMRNLGLARNRLPAEILKTLRGEFQPEALSAPAPSRLPAVEKTDPPPPPPSRSVAAPGFDPHAELKAAEDRLLALRSARDEAYANNLRSEGDRLDREYWEKYNDFTGIARRVTDYLEKRGELVAKSAVEAELAPRIVGIAVGGMYFFARIQPQLMAAPDLAAQNEIWKRFWAEQVGALLSAQFVPDFIRRAPADLWRELCSVVESHRPPDLRLESLPA